MQDYHGWGAGAIWARAKPAPEGTKKRVPSYFSTAPWDSRINTETTPVQIGGPPHV